MAVSAKIALRSAIAVLLFVVIAKGNEGEGSGDVGNKGKEYGDVCNVDGSTCPDDKCCREAECTKDGGELTCCEDPSSDPTCANCPKCGKSGWMSYYRKIIV